MVCGLSLLSVGAIAGEATVTGTAFYRERIALPPSAVFTAVLQDSSLQDVAATEVGRDVIDPAGHPPYRFEITYDPAKIDPRHTYTVRASITDGERLMFASDRVHPVLTPGAGNTVEIQMKMTGKQTTAAEPRPTRFHGLFRYMADAATFEECRTGRTFPVAMERDFRSLQQAYSQVVVTPGAGALTSLSATIEPRPKMNGAGTEPTMIVHRVDNVLSDQDCKPPIPDAPLTDTYWRLSDLAGERIGDVPGDRDPYILLESSRARYRATAGCNGLGGEYELAGENVTFKPGISTLMACPPPVDGYESGLKLALFNTATWEIHGVILSLIDAHGKVLARFRAVYLQ